MHTDYVRVVDRPSKGSFGSKTLRSLLVFGIGRLLTVKLTHATQIANGRIQAVRVRVAGNEASRARLRRTPARPRHSSPEADLPRQSQSIIDLDPKIIGPCSIFVYVREATGPLADCRSCRWICAALVRRIECVP